MKKIIAIVGLFVHLSAFSQVFEDAELKLLVKKSADHIYNSAPDSAAYYTDLVYQKLPDHPVVPLMKAMTVLWANVPTISEELFQEMQDELHYAVELAETRDPDLEDPEMIFFAMASHGLLAEYYADQEYDLRAVGEANKAYGLMKKGFEIVEDYPEFLFTTGLYNYFREKYPEKHPVYKPLLWFFRDGDMQLGLKQLEEACEVSVLSQVEAHVYLSYIYLRYEYKPTKAQEYLGILIEKYPNNFYAKAKYLESLANPEDFKRAPVEVIYALTQHKNPYYKLAGNVFLGYFEEVVVGNNENAEFAYREGLKYGEELSHHGEYFKGIGYLGLGRVLMEKGNSVAARQNLELALKYPETEQIVKETKELLSKL